MKPTRTLQRGLAILEALANSEEPMGPTQVAQGLGLDKATAGRLLFTLADLGYARQTGNGSYRLTSKLLSLANHAAVEPDLRIVARPHLISLRDDTDETVHLGVREDMRVVYIDKIEAHQSIRLVSAIGQTMPLHTTSLGKAALAWMDKDDRENILSDMKLERRTPNSITSRAKLRDDLELSKRRGYTVDDRENEEQATCVGAPVFSGGGNVVAMVSLSGPSERINLRRDDLGKRCRDCADAVSSELTHTSS
jgi:DNA-binding IclR family transcriptional regulator